MSGHTPGPWFAEANDYYWEIRHNSRELVASACESKYLEAGDNGEANARLIAAAPELLDELKALLTERHDADVDALIAVAYAAIAKAEGKP